MIGYLSGKFLTADDGGGIIVDVGGVGYSVLAPARLTQGLNPGSPIDLHIHTNMRENALELFGFESVWEKKVFYALTSVSGVGPKTAMGMLGGLEPETILSAILREDRATLTSAPGIGKKTADLLIVQLAEKARKLLAERPRTAGSPATSAEALAVSGKKKKDAGQTPAQGASASPLEVADLWNEALAALTNLGYRDADAIAAIRLASGKATQAGESPSLEKLIMSSLQLMSRGL